MNYLKEVMVRILDFFFFESFLFFNLFVSYSKKKKKYQFSILFSCLTIIHALIAIS